MSDRIKHADLNAVRAGLADAAKWQSEKRHGYRVRSYAVLWHRLWCQALQTQHPGIIVKVPDRAFRNLKVAVDRSSIPIGDLAELLPWTIANWPHLRRNLFTYNPGKPYGPGMPDVGFVIKILPRVHERFLRARDLAQPINPMQ